MDVWETRHSECAARADSVIEIILEHDSKNLHGVNVREQGEQSAEVTIESFTHRFHEDLSALKIRFGFNVQRNSQR